MQCVYKLSYSMVVFAWFNQGIRKVKSRSGVCYNIFLNFCDAKKRHKSDHLSVQTSSKLLVGCKKNTSSRITWSRIGGCLRQKNTSISDSENNKIQRSRPSNCKTPDFQKLYRATLSWQLGMSGVDIAALQETTLEGSGMIKEIVFSIFWSGVEAGERSQAGVSLAVRNDFLKKMKTLPKVISDSIIVMRLPLSNNKLNLRR